MKRKMSFLVAGLLCLSLCLGAEAAGTVTDTLTVRVGYYGMGAGPLCGGRDLPLERAL